MPKVTQPLTGMGPNAGKQPQKALQQPLSLAETVKEQWCVLPASYSR